MQRVRYNANVTSAGWHTAPGWCGQLFRNVWSNTWCWTPGLNYSCYDDFVMHFMYIICVHACVLAHSTVKWLRPISAKSYASDCWHSHMTATNWRHEPTHVNCHVCMPNVYALHVHVSTTAGNNTAAGTEPYPAPLWLSFHPVPGSNVEPDQPDMYCTFEKRK